MEKNSYQFIVNILLLFLVGILSNLPARTQEPRIVLPIGHGGLLQSASFSLDGKRVMTTALDFTTKVWDVASGALLTDLPNAFNTISNPVFSPDGKNILTASSSTNTSKIWDVSTGNIVAELKGHQKMITTAIYDGAGERIVTTSFDGTARLWDAAAGNLLFELKGNNALLFTAAFSSDGTLLVTGGEDSIANVWETATGKLAGTLKSRGASFRSFVFGPANTKIFSTSWLDNDILVWEEGTGKLSGKLKGHSGNISSISLSPDGKKMVSASDDGTAIVWDLHSGSKLNVLKLHRGRLTSASFSHNGKMILTASEDATAKIWDANNGSLLKDMTGHSSRIESASFSPDDTKILTAGTEQAAYIWDVSSGKIINTLTGHTNYITCASLSPDGSRLVTSSIDGRANLWDAKLFRIQSLLETPYSIKTIHFSHDGRKIVSGSFYGGVVDTWDGFTGKKLLAITGHRKTVNVAIFSPDDTKIVSVADDSSAKVWDAASGRLLMELRGIKGSVKSAAFSRDGKRIATTEYNSVKIWEVESGNLIREFKGFGEDVLSADFSPNGLFIVTGTGNGKVQVWGIASGHYMADLSTSNEEVSSVCFMADGASVLFTCGNQAFIRDMFSPTKRIEFKSHRSRISTVFFNPDSNYVFTASADHTCKMWNAKTGKLLTTFMPIDEADYMAISPGGYYTCSPAAAKLVHYVSPKLEVITFEQLDLKYNRPDKILEATGNTDTMLLTAYRKAYYKRIAKNNIDTSFLNDVYSVPVADFVNRRDIGYEQRNHTIKLIVRASDKAFGLDRFNVWVNGCPVYGQKGINLRRRNSNYFDTSIYIKLSPGENNIETSVTNVNGTESYRTPLYINYKPVTVAKEKLYFIGIGLDAFKDEKHNLQYSVKDIRDLSKRFRNRYGNNITIDTLFNEQVTGDRIKALKQKLKQAGEDDKVIIAYSGHGLLSREFDYYLSTYSVNFEKPEEGGLPYAELEDLLDSIPSRKKLLLIDACHSGEVDKEELRKITDEQAVLKKDNDVITGGRGLKLPPVQNKLGMKNSFELMQELFANVNRRTGATIISAAAGTQFALERGDLKNGVFTYCVLELLQPGKTVTIGQLKKHVSSRVSELTNGLQQPTERNEIQSVDWTL